MRGFSRSRIRWFFWWQKQRKNRAFLPPEKLRKYLAVESVDRRELFDRVPREFCCLFDGVTQKDCGSECPIVWQS